MDDVVAGSVPYWCVTVRVVVWYCVMCHLKFLAPRGGRAYDSATSAARMGHFVLAAHSRDRSRLTHSISIQYQEF